MGWDKSSCATRTNLLLARSAACFSMISILHSNSLSLSLSLTSARIHNDVYSRCNEILSNLSVGSRVVHAFAKREDQRRATTLSSSTHTHTNTRTHAYTHARIFLLTELYDPGEGGTRASSSAGLDTQQRRSKLGRSAVGELRGTPTRWPGDDVGR